MTRASTKEKSNSADVVETFLALSLGDLGIISQRYADIPARKLRNELASFHVRASLKAKDCLAQTSTLERFEHPRGSPSRRHPRDHGATSALSPVRSPTFAINSKLKHELLVWSRAKGVGHAVIR
jgi:hypothetical protein